MEASSVSDILYKQLNYRSERQKVISTNIANLDTPNYKTRDIKFKTELEKANSNEPFLTLTTTNKYHMQIDKPTLRQPDLMSYEVEGLEEQNDGNNVNLDDQMSQQAQNDILFNAIQASIKKDTTWFKSIIDASAKN